MYSLSYSGLEEPGDSFFAASILVNASMEALNNPQGLRVWGLGVRGSGLGFRV